MGTGFGAAPSGQQNLLGFNAAPTTNTSTGLGGLTDLTGLGGLGGLGSLGGSNVAAAPSSSDSVVVKAAEDSNLDVSFHCKKDNQNTVNITTNFVNKSYAQIRNIVFQVAVQKHCKLNMNPISSNTIAPNGTVTQVYIEQKIFY